MTPSLNEQLDHIEALRARVPVQEPRERLQTLCKSLYGEEVPETWLDEALAQPTTDLATPPVKPGAVPPAATDRSRAALLWWSKQSYARPTSRAAWKAQRAHLTPLVTKWDEWDTCGLIGLLVGLLGGFFGVLICATLGAHWPTVLSVAVAGGTLAAVSVLLASRNWDALKKAKKLRQAYKKTKPTEKEWVRWSHSEAVAPLLLEWLDSEVPLLRGDVKRLRQLIKQENRQRKQRDLRAQVAQLPTPQGRVRFA